MSDTPEVDAAIMAISGTAYSDRQSYNTMVARARDLERRLQEAQRERDKTIIERDYALGQREFQQERADAALHEVKALKMALDAVVDAVYAKAHE